MKDFLPPPPPPGDTRYGFVEYTFLSTEAQQMFKWYVSKESESRWAVSDSLRSRGRYSPWILRARILEWVAISFSRGSSRPRDWTRVSHIVGRRFTLWATREAPG